MKIRINDQNNLKVTRDAMTFTLDLDLDFYFHIEDCTLASSINPSFSFAIIILITLATTPPPPHYFRERK